jgi:hypothetical protein
MIMIKILLIEANLIFNKQCKDPKQILLTNYLNFSK